MESRTPTEKQDQQPQRQPVRLTEELSPFETEIREDRCFAFYYRFDLVLNKMNKSVEGFVSLLIANTYNYIIAECLILSEVPEIYTCHEGSRYPFLANSYRYLAEFKMSFNDLKKTLEEIKDCAPANIEPVSAVRFFQNTTDKKLEQYNKLVRQLKESIIHLQIDQEENGKWISRDSIVCVNNHSENERNSSSMFSMCALL